MIEFVRAIVPSMAIRQVQDDFELQQCLVLRNSYDNAFGPRPDVPVSVIWWVAIIGTRVVACAGFCPVPGERKIIATDLYHDRTRDGLRGLSALMRDFFDSDLHVCANIPLDNPALARALVSRGLRLTGYSVER